MKESDVRPESYKMSGKKGKRAIFWKRGKRPTDKSPKGFLGKKYRYSRDFVLKEVGGLDKFFPPQK